MDTDRAPRIEFGLFNLPAKLDWFMPHRGFFESFVRSRTSQDFYMGFDTAQTIRRGSTYRDIRPACLHHNVPFEEMQRRTRVKLSDRVHAAAYFRVNPGPRDWKQTPPLHFCLHSWKRHRESYRLGAIRVPKLSLSTPASGRTPRPLHRASGGNVSGGREDTG